MCWGGNKRDAGTGEAAIGIDSDLEEVVRGGLTGR